MNLEFLNIRRILRLAAAIAAVAAAAAVVVVAASYAVYALALTWLTPAAAAAAVAGVFAVIAVVVAWVVARPVTPPPKKPGAPQDDATLADRLIGMAKERPLMALGAAAAATFVLIRNPAVVTAVVSAFMAGNASKPEK
ncbi:hypothetical protein [Phenylobacterium sp.]|uniref:hypothetical protein n=1 Tax=Phenylobacterium sp. TaxID=1871053 RepID=UPI0025EC0F2B|nr:hypothetical protein [Phenylobacterium sp.]MBX3483632.1 hypothetical protein [Phenylobacterium sp.]MCW5761052.1 hypothetical protein [Phenylobacterium sp.]